MFFVYSLSLCLCLSVINSYTLCFPPWSLPPSLPLKHTRTWIARVCAHSCGCESLSPGTGQSCPWCCGRRLIAAHCCRDLLGITWLCALVTWWVKSLGHRFSTKKKTRLKPSLTHRIWGYFCTEPSKGLPNSQKKHWVKPRWRMPDMCRHE